MPRIGTRTLAQLLRRVSIGLHAGVDARTVWKKESEIGSPAHRQQVTLVHQRVAAGDSCADALTACPGYFPALTCDLVDVGEKTGRLDEVLAMLADHYEHLLQLRRVFLLGIFWPALQLGVAIGIVGILIWVWGALGSLNPGGKPVDLLGFGLVGTPGLVKFVLLIAAIAGGATWLVLALVRGSFGPRPLAIAMRVPVLGGCLQTSALSRFAWTLSLTLDAGVDAVRSLGLALRSTQNAYYTAHTAAAERAIVAGREFHEALRETGAFPDDFLVSLETAELAGKPGETLQRLANEYRDRAKSAARVLAIAAAFVVWGGVVVLLVLLIFRLFFMAYAPLFDLVKEVQH